MARCHDTKNITFIFIPFVNNFMIKLSSIQFIARHCLIPILLTNSEESCPTYVNDVNQEEKVFHLVYENNKVRRQQNM